MAIRIGMIGAGNISKSHLGTLTVMPEFEVAAITDVFLAAAQQRAEEFHIPRVYESVDELLGDPAIDAVVIGVPNKFHAPLAISALKAGKHVMVEKPMAINASAAKEILLAQRDSGKTLLVTQQRRWESLNLQVKEHVERGSLGNIYHAKTGWFRRKGIPGWGTWFTRMSESGGGPLIDIGVHMLDLTLFLMGNPKPVSVFGATYAEFGPKKRGIGSWGTPDWNGYYDVEDLATALIKMDNGATLTLDVSWAVHTDNNNPYIQLMGSDGGASIRGNNAKLMTEQFNTTLDVDLKFEKEGDEGSRTRMYKHFVECVNEGKQPISSALTGYTNNLILEAIYESSRTGNEIKLDWNF
ncbi:MAG: oxidoreductase domain protein [Paenibacillaceae bacterium]|nr:oxidoreductase domain protein [Paenibacillaceae bacterium]